MRSRELAISKVVSKRQQYSISLIAAMSQDKILASQIIEGGVDSVLFENFIFHTLRSVRTDKNLQLKPVLLFMDNAVIHKHSEVLETARKMKVNVLFNAQYSPWLNPVEQLFGHIKKQLQTESIDSK